MNYRYCSSRSSRFFALLLLTSLFTMFLPHLPPTLIFLSPSPCLYLRSCHTSCHKSCLFTSGPLTFHFKPFFRLLIACNTVFSLLGFFHSHSFDELFPLLNLSIFSSISAAVCCYFFPLQASSPFFLRSPAHPSIWGLVS